MIYIDKFEILPTDAFISEFEEFIYYIKRKLKQPVAAKKFYNLVTKEINSLQFMPERYKRIKTNYKSRNIRRMLLNKYIIVYEVNKDIRASFYSTYFP